MTGIISTKTHSILNYILAAVIGASPWIFGYADKGAALLFIPLFIGVTQFLMGMFSKYEYGMIQQFPMPMHLSLDVFSGFVLLVSPFLYGFCEIAFWPQVILGLISMFMGIYTKNSPLSDDGFTVFDPRGM